MKITDQNNKAKDRSHIEFPDIRVNSLLRQTGGNFMKNIKNILFLSVTMTLFSFGKIQADGGAGTVGGLTLLEPAGARPASMGEAFTAATNDISAMNYNAASLKSLESGQANFTYQKGLADDSYGHFMIGAPIQQGTLRLSLDDHNPGSIQV